MTVTVTCDGMFYATLGLSVANFVHTKNCGKSKILYQLAKMILANFENFVPFLVTK